ncbi:Pre-mRNA-splicing factor of RES complex-domain-containing protein [Entophlyctis helioformis]|nr:Pre-mRNA-splicing factor of RES complex-domain-containing protein [Entophlyctis helioformis]
MADRPAGPAAKKPKKPKKRLPANASTLVVDDDADDWMQAAGDNDEDGPVVAGVDEAAARFKRPEESGWVTLREGDPTRPPRMEDGTTAGLQTGASIRADNEKKLREQASRMAALEARNLTGKDAETVYRDKHGRKVDIAAQLAAAEAEQRAKDAKEADRLKWARGHVQQEAAKSRHQRLQDESTTPFAVYADDAERDSGLRDRGRWGDPMAFMTAAKTADADADAAGGRKRRGRRLPRAVYKGPPPPANRFGIAPGYRWDGVDRSNGFEKQYYQSKHAKAITAEKAHMWSTENM